MTNLTQKLAPYLLAIGLAGCATPKAEVANYSPTTATTQTRSYEDATATDNPDVRGSVRRLVELLRRYPKKESFDIRSSHVDPVVGTKYLYKFDYEGKGLLVSYRDFAPEGHSEGYDSLTISSPTEEYTDTGLDGLTGLSADGFTRRDIMIKVDENCTYFCNFGYEGVDIHCNNTGLYVDSAKTKFYSQPVCVASLAEEKYLSLVADLTRYLESEALSNKSKQNN